MRNFYETAVLIEFLLIFVTGLILLIRATGKYKMDIIWWIASIPLWFAPGYIAYFDAKRKYLASKGAQQKDIDMARKQSIISLIFIIGAWVAVLVACVVVFMKSRSDPSALEVRPTGIIFWSLAAVILAYLLALWLTSRKDRSNIIHN